MCCPDKLMNRETAEMALAGLITKVNDLDPENVIEVVASTFDVTPDEILGKGRSREVVLPRQIVMFLLRTDGEMEFLKIGQVLGRDHTTIMYGCDKITERLKQNGSLECTLRDIRTKLGEVLVRDPV
jgi:chromosomal replication initiator protein